MRAGTTTGETELLPLVARRPVGPAPGSTADAVRRLGAVQTQDPSGALASVALPTRGGLVATAIDALGRAPAVRTRPM